MEDIKQLYEMYSNDIYKFILSLTLNKHIAEDIMQNTFVSAINSIGTFKEYSSVKTWLIGIAKNEYYTYLRKNPLNIYLEESTLEGLVYIQETSEVYYTIINEINKLDQVQREIAILRLVNDLSFKDIGAITKKSENYCRVCFFRIKKKFAEVLRGD